MYGVEVPDTGGRAGMVAIQLKDGQEFDGKALAKAVYEQAARLRGAAVRPGGRGTRAHVDVQEPEGGPAQGGLRRQLGEGDEEAKIEDPIYVLSGRDEGYVAVLRRVPRRGEGRQEAEVAAAWAW